MCVLRVYLTGVGSQAEFLVYKFFPWSLISGIAVYDEKIAEQVGKMLQNGEVTTKIRVKREWYY